LHHQRDRKEIDTMHDAVSKKAMTDAVAAYNGPVTRCRPGSARGRRIIPKNEAVGWLIDHRHKQAIADPKAQRSRKRKQQAERRRIAKRNTAILERLGKQERRSAFNQEAVQRLNEQQKPKRRITPTLAPLAGCGVNNVGER
jgi:ferric-dicitrate binding protein FerR (iron transport regulator)